MKTRLFGTLLVASTIGLVGCRATTEVPVLSADEVAQAVPGLSAPVSGDLSAIYRLRIQRAGGLRMSVLARPDSGRLTISRPFGDAVSAVGWEPNQLPVLVDYREGCSVRAASIMDLLGVGSLPLPQAVRLISGRLPATSADRVTVESNGQLKIVGPDWKCLVFLAPNPWRVTRVESADVPVDSQWSIDLSDHEQVVPKRLRFEGSSERWAEIELRQLQWHPIDNLPAMPEMPPCREVKSEE